MSINWFPGHMHKAIKEIKEILPKVDVIIEVLDSRIPYSSANPVIEEFRGNKPSIKLLSKSDLADPVVTQAWLEHFQKQEGVRALAVTTQKTELIRGLADLCKQMLTGQENKIGNITALITGIPNVGKSTIINTLAGKPIAKAGNEPAVTTTQQRIDLRNGLILIDSPGILWPKIHNASSGYRLALSGAIRDTAISHDDVAFFAAGYFLKAYPEMMKQRFKLDELPATEVEFLEVIGRQRGTLSGGGHVDFNRISSILLKEFRNATLGLISLETPADAEAEKILVQRALDEKAASKDADKKKRKSDFSARNKKD